MRIFATLLKNGLGCSGQKVAIDVRPKSGDVRALPVRRRNCNPLDLRRRLGSEGGDRVDTDAPGKAQTRRLLGLAIAGLGKSAALNDSASKIAFGEWRGAKVQH